jgi:hypothetical protein
LGDNTGIDLTSEEINPGIGRIPVKNMEESQKVYNKLHTYIHQKPGKNMWKNKACFIGLNAFFNCSQLALTELPSGLTSIDRQAFSGCTKLALTELPSGLTSIGINAFDGCSQLKNIRILNTTSKITSATNMFTSNPVIEVPSALLADYQADVNWSKYNLVAY